MAERALPDEDPLKTNQVPDSVVGVSCFCFAQVMRSLIDLFGFHRISLVPSFHAWVFWVHFDVMLSVLVHMLKVYFLMEDAVNIFEARKGLGKILAAKVCRMDLHPFTALNR